MELSGELDEELNRDYSPSFWSKRFPQTQVVENHLITVSRASEVVMKSVPHLKNVKYGEKVSWVMDIFGTSLPRDSPVFVYIHGGYWQSLNKDISCYLVEPLFKAGIKVIVPEYDLAPTASLGEIIEQIKIMGQHVLNEAAENRSRSVWFGGHSAGAHLAVSLLDPEWYLKLNTEAQQILKGFVLISGLYNLVPLLRTEYNAALNLDKSTSSHLSPVKKDLNWIKNYAKTFYILLAAGENDSPAFQQQTSNYTEHLTKHGIETEYIFLKGLDHFDIVEKLSEESYLLTQKIISYVNGIITEEKV